MTSDDNDDNDDDKHPLLIVDDDDVEESDHHAGSTNALSRKVQTQLVQPSPKQSMNILLMSDR